MAAVPDEDVVAEEAQSFRFRERRISFVYAQGRRAIWHSYAIPAILEPVLRPPFGTPARRLHSKAAASSRDKR
jgi:hypothetical protein